MFIIYIAKIIHDFEMNLKFKKFSKNIKKLFKFLSKKMITLTASCACLFMLFFVCFPLFRSYIARYAPLKNEKTS